MGVLRAEDFSSLSWGQPAPGSFLGLRVMLLPGCRLLHSHGSGTVRQSSLSPWDGWEEDETEVSPGGTVPARGPGSRSKQRGWRQGRLRPCDLWFPSLPKVPSGPALPRTQPSCCVTPRTALLPGAAPTDWLAGRVTSP